LILYELLGNISVVWDMLVSYHLGLVQHLAMVLRTLLCLALSIGPFLQSSYILLQKNSPRDRVFEAKLKNELLFVKGVIAVTKTHIWSIEGMQRVCNLHIKVMNEDYDTIQRNIYQLLNGHFTRDSDLTVQLDKAGA